jgi:hypothetical protein
MNVRSALSGVEQQCKGEAFAGALSPALLKYCDFLLIPGVDFFCAVGSCGRRRITICLAPIV